MKCFFLLLLLIDFKRNELKIQINKYGVMTVSGETQPAKVASKISRFTKRIRISSDYYNEDQIHAKFVSGILYITMPHRGPRSKTSNDRTDLTENVKNIIKGSTSHINGINDMPQLECVRESCKKQSGSIKKNAMETYDAMCKEMSYGFESIKGLISDAEKGQNVALVASIVAVSSFGAYAVYKFWSGSQKT